VVVQEPLVVPVVREQLLLRESAPQVRLVERVQPVPQPLVVPVLVPLVPQEELRPLVELPPQAVEPWPLVPLLVQLSLL
jgi:hypothetical protein